MHSVGVKVASVLYTGSSSKWTRINGKPVKQLAVPVYEHIPMKPFLPCSIGGRPFWQSWQKPSGESHCDQAQL